MGTAPTLLWVGIAGATPAADPVEAMQAAWSEVNAYCVDFVMTLHNSTNSAISVGEQCWERRGVVRTETQVEGLGAGHSQRSRALVPKPEQPKVLHVRTDESVPWSGGQIGQGLGELVGCSPNRLEFSVEEDVAFNGRTLWVRHWWQHDGVRAVVFVDADHHLPTAFEIHRQGQPVMSVVYPYLSVDPLLPEGFFSIQPRAHEEVVEVEVSREALRSEGGSGTARLEASMSVFGKIKVGLAVFLAFALDSAGSESAAANSRTTLSPRSTITGRAVRWKASSTSLARVQRNSRRWENRGAFADELGQRFQNGQAVNDLGALGVGVLKGGWAGITGLPLLGGTAWPHSEWGWPTVSTRTPWCRHWTSTSPHPR